MASGAKPEVIKKLHLIEILHKEAQAVLSILGRLFLSICLYLLCFSVYVCICNPLFLSVCLYLQSLHLMASRAKHEARKELRLSAVS